MRVPFFQSVTNEVRARPAGRGRAYRKEEEEKVLPPPLLLPAGRG